MPPGDVCGLPGQAAEAVEPERGRSGGQRQEKEDFRPLLPAAGLNGSAVGPDDGPADREPQAHVPFAVAAGALAGQITGWCLRQCFAPFVHIPRWDQPLLGLYQKLGYTVSEKPLYWLGDGPEEQDPSQEL